MVDTNVYAVPLGDNLGRVIRRMPLAAQPGSRMLSHPDPSLIETLDSCDDAGSPVSDATRNAVEDVCGVSLSDVRIHIEPKIENLNARALAFGRDLFFAPRAFETGTANGRRLLCHELAHVAQEKLGMLPALRSEAAVFILRSPELELHADTVAALASGFLESGLHSTIRCIHRPMVQASSTRRAIQLQGKGVLAEELSLAPGEADQAVALAEKAVIFWQTSTTNEVYPTRALARARCLRKLNLTPNLTAIRTYHSNAAHGADESIGEGTNYRFMKDRQLHPVEAYGRYYDFGDGKLLVEHTSDANCRLIEVTKVSPALVSFRCWGPPLPLLPHFHIAAYEATADHPEYGAGLHVGAPDPLRGQPVEGSPPGYLMPNGIADHHIYYLGVADLKNRPFAEFNDAYADTDPNSSRAKFNKFWVELRK